MAALIRHITQEPALIAPHLLGTPLATFRRRLAAYLVDLFLFGLVFGSLFCGLTLLKIHRTDPTLMSRLWATAGGTVAADSLANRVLLMDCLAVVDAVTPEALPPELAAQVRARNEEAIRAVFGDGDNKTLTFTSGPTRLTGDRFELGLDFLLGSYSSLLGWGALFVGWFTVWTWLGRGRTPGKALLRVQIKKLDGRPLSWWDAFGRSAGYGASAGTLLLGFLEAIWHPNRQAIHDRIAGTVVVRR